MKENNFSYNSTINIRVVYITADSGKIVVHCEIMLHVQPQKLNKKELIQWYNVGMCLSYI